MFVLKSCRGLHVHQQEKHVETSCIIPYYIRKRTTVDFTSESQSLLFIVRRRGDGGTRVILSRELPYNGRTVRIFSFLSPPTESSTLYIWCIYRRILCRTSSCRTPWWSDHYSVLAINYKLLKLPDFRFSLVEYSTIQRIHIINFIMYMISLSNLHSALCIK